MQVSLCGDIVIPTSESGRHRTSMEVLTWFSLVWCLCWIHLHTTLGSEVKLTANPVTITEGLTDVLKLRCSLQDTAAAGVVVGRQVSSSTDYDIQHVNSIIISRVNTDETVTSLAQIITSENAQVFGNSQTLTAAGTLSPSDPADPEYLELTWTNPGKDQSGSYTCEVNGLDLEGHSVMLQKNIAVDSVDPEVEDLVKEIQDLKSVISDLKTIVASQAPHNEVGDVDCGNSDNWLPAPTEFYLTSTGRQTVKSVTFNRPYATPPTIMIAAVQEDSDGTLNDRYIYDVRDVTTTGFKIVCYTWAGSHIYHLKVRWTSFVS